MPDKLQVVGGIAQRVQERRLKECDKREVDLLSFCLHKVILGGQADFRITERSPK